MGHRACHVLMDTAAHENAPSSLSLHFFFRPHFEMTAFWGYVSVHQKKNKGIIDEP
eukprot:CAMPEP_0174385702 /NCGR_PEP_ID=MMETSP0811_2-20130205/126783_1 /TAXON_ID=73025 ORGANISM="Eutreptiella gymnastica-like, Strain CCMP1594" /NCGR_SAMPLE_ID=MMETSP0811_2 /ASSEMBLY_ACC=CAM_ASM_000667 /LENGTH=55 /DNA_ID=CAMNT_0015540119 /DNA_START=218 /DNA_END=385 /DNA_ORIENTATION=-